MMRLQCWGFFWAVSTWDEARQESSFIWALADLSIGTRTLFPRPSGQTASEGARTAEDVQRGGVSGGCN